MFLKQIQVPYLLKSYSIYSVGNFKEEALLKTYLKSKQYGKIASQIKDAKKRFMVSSNQITAL